NGDEEEAVDTSWVDATHAHRVLDVRVEFDTSRPVVRNDAVHVFAGGQLLLWDKSVSTEQDDVVAVAGLVSGPLALPAYSGAKLRRVLLESLCKLCECKELGELPPVRSFVAEPRQRRVTQLGAVALREAALRKCLRDQFQGRVSLVGSATVPVTSLAHALAVSDDEDLSDQAGTAGIKTPVSLPTVPHSKTGLIVESTQLVAIAAALGVLLLAWLLRRVLADSDADSNCSQCQC
ncbi:MAG: hypothetical protein MHM6MM_006689, partial [Cercozoa sp. M6MM]